MTESDKHKLEMIESCVIDYGEEVRQSCEDFCAKDHDPEWLYMLGMNWTDGELIDAGIHKDLPTPILKKLRWYFELWLDEEKSREKQGYQPNTDDMLIYEDGIRELDLELEKRKEG